MAKRRKPQKRLWKITREGFKTLAWLCLEAFAKRLGDGLALAFFAALAVFFASFF
jgi:hypothetical protein